MNERQKNFALNYLANGGNATKAAEMAGYSAKTAYSVGGRLLKNVEVRQFLNDKLREIEDKQIVQAKETLKFLSAVMRGQVTEKVVVQVGGKSNLRAELIEKPLSGRERLKAAELLARINGLFEQEEKVDAAQLLVTTLTEIWKGRNED